MGNIFAGSLPPGGGNYAIHESGFSGNIPPGSFAEYDYTWSFEVVSTDAPLTAALLLPWLAAAALRRSRLPYRSVPRQHPIGA